MKTALRILVFSILSALVLLLVGIAEAQSVSSSSEPTTLNVTGTGFTSTTAFKFNGVACTASGVTATSAVLACPISVTGVSAANPCTVAALNVWTLVPFAAQTGNFEVTFTANPVTANQDGVIGFGPAGATAYAQLAGTLRFNSSGFIDAVNSSASSGYSAVTSVPYVTAGSYPAKFDVNVTAKTYSLYVQVGGTWQTIALNYPFRTGAPTTNFAALSLIVDAGTSSTISACNLQILPYPTATVAWQAGAAVPGVTVTQYQVQRAPTAGGTYTLLATVTGTSYVDLGVMHGGAECYKITAIGSNGVVSPQSSPAACGAQ